MNLINKGLLNLALLPKALYTKMDINIDHLRSILFTKLIMDDRRPTSIQQARGGQPIKDIKWASLLTMLVSLLMGLAFMIILSLEGSYTAKLTIYFTAFIFMLALTLVSDFTHVLIDVRDNYIIMPKPVNDKTIVISRLLHILIHLFRIVFPMLLPGAVYLGIVDGLMASILFLFLAIFATLISVFLINSVYIIILRITTPQKFKNIITSIQILFSIIVYTSYRLIVDSMDATDFESLLVLTSNWWILAPPFWFASAFNLIYIGEGTLVEIVSAVLAFILPVISIYIVVKYLAPAFNQKLTMIGGSGESTEKGSNTILSIKKGLIDRIAPLITSDNQEKAGFMFTWKLMARSRDFKMRVYPTIGYMAVIAGLALFKSLAKSGFDLSSLQKFHYIIDIYVTGFLLTMVLRQLNYSEKFTGNWIFYAAPIDKPGHLINGAIKAASLKFNLWIAFILIILGSVVGGAKYIPDMLFAMCNIYLVNYMLVYINKKKLPFSSPINEVGEAIQVMMILGMLLIGGIVGGIHYFISGFPMVVLGATLLSAFILVLVIKSIKEVTWSQINI